MEVALEIKDFAMRRGSREWTGLNLTLQPGELCILAGENGSGKSTLVQAIMGFKPVAGGSLKILGLSRGEPGWEQARLRIGYVASEKEIYPAWLKVGSLLSHLPAVYESWDEGFAASLVQAFGLDVGKRLNDLSLGEHSKARLVKALAMQPRLLILDELTANLSPSSQAAVTAGLISYFDRKKPAILYVSHSEDEMRRLSDRLVCLSDSGLIELGVGEVVHV